jgi:serine phosphatase RsbU (regulator of sigma subunit)
MMTQVNFGWLIVLFIDGLHDGIEAAHENAIKDTDNFLVTER